MTDKEYAEMKRRIKAVVKKWYQPAGWGWWRTEFVYSRERQPGNDQVAAETHCDFKYSHASITFYLPVLANMTDEELEHTIVHEFCHLTASCFPNFEDNQDAASKFERVVDDFAKQMIWAHEHVKEKS